MSKPSANSSNSFITCVEGETKEIKVAVECEYCKIGFERKGDLFDHYTTSRACGRKAEKAVLKSTGIPGKTMRINLTGVLNLF